MKIQYFFAVLVFMNCGCGALDRVRDSEGATTYDGGQNLEARGDRTRAIRYYEDIKKGSPYYVKAQTRLGEICYEAGDLRQSLTHLDNVLNQLGSKTDKKIMDLRDKVKNSVDREEEDRRVRDVEVAKTQTIHDKNNDDAMKLAKKAASKAVEKVSQMYSDEEIKQAMAAGAENPSGMDLYKVGWRYKISGGLVKVLAGGVLNSHGLSHQDGQFFEYFSFLVVPKTMKIYAGNVTRQAIAAERLRPFKGWQDPVPAAE